VFLGFIALYQSLTLNGFSTKQKVIFFIIYILFLLFTFLLGMKAMTMESANLGGGSSARKERVEVFWLVWVSGLLSLVPWIFLFSKFLSTYREKQSLFVEHLSIGVIIISIIIISLVSIFSRILF
jgi:hypothetical protein